MVLFSYNASMLEWEVGVGKRSLVEQHVRCVWLPRIRQYINKWIKEIQKEKKSFGFVKYWDSGQDYLEAHEINGTGL